METEEVIPAKKATKGRKAQPARTVKKTVKASYDAMNEGDVYAVVTWSPVEDKLEPTAVPDGYVVYTAIDDNGYDQGTYTKEPKYRTRIDKDHIYRFKVTAVNAGGESFASEVVAAGVPSQRKSEDIVLVVNAFDRVGAPKWIQSKDSTMAGFFADYDHGVPYLKDASYLGKMYEYRRNVPWTDDDAPGFGACYNDQAGNIIAGNTFDYAYDHGLAFMHNGYAFISSTRSAVESGKTDMTRYSICDLIMGKQCQSNDGALTKLVKYHVYTPAMKKAITDFCAQGLRNIIIGVGGPKDGYLMESKVGIAVGSELMAILAVARDLKDLRERIGKVVVAYSRSGEPVTCEDLEVAGAMTAWMRNTINPTMCYTVEHQPVLIHAGPFANIAIGQSSVIADRLALKLFDYHVTESGFAADIGFEKFWNVKTRLSGLTPNVSVIVATVRALKMHGGGPKVVPGRPLPVEYTEENLELVEKGCENLFHHVNTVLKSGIVPVVCINQFYTDTDNEIALIKRLCAERGVRCAQSNHWRYGGEGAVELAQVVVEACEQKPEIKFLYDLDMPLRERVERIAKEVYGADGVDWAPLAIEKAKRFESDPKYADYCTMMVKTHLSLSHDPTLKGVPKGWRLPIRDILEYGGAKFLCPMAGTISMMPGTASDPAYRRVDVDTETGKVSGLF